jgi:hypothetical protein
MWLVIEIALGVVIGLVAFVVLYAVGKDKGLWAAIWF